MDDYCFDSKGTYPGTVLGTLSTVDNHLVDRGAGVTGVVFGAIVALHKLLPLVCSLSHTMLNLHHN